MHITKLSRLFIVLTVGLLNLTVSYGQSVRLSVSGQPGVGDTFHIIIETSNVDAEPTPVRNVDGCSVLYPLQLRSRSQKAIVVNGVAKATSQASYAVTLRAEHPGSYSFGPINVGGVSSNKVSFRIKAKGSSTGSGLAPDPTTNTGPKLTGTSGGDLTLKASVSNTQPYEHQGVEYTVRLFTSYTSIFDWGATASPKFSNCTYEASDAVSRQLNMTEQGGKAVMTAVIARYILYPTTSGKTTLLGNSYTGSVAQRFTYEDPFYGTMSQVQPKQIEARPNDIVLNVRPLPPHEGELSGVGSFKVSASLPKSNLTAYQAATVRYTISGTGNLGFLSLPDLNGLFPQELKFLKSEDKMRKSVGANSVSGDVTFEVTFIPQREGEWEIPSVKFLFFDPEAGQYYTRQVEGFKLHVAPGTGGNALKSLNFNQDLLPLGHLSKTHILYVSRPLIWLWYIIPTLCFIALAFAYRHRLKNLADITGRKRKGASKMARLRLRAAEKALRAGNQNLFYEEMLQALWGYLADRLSIPTSELSRLNVSQMLNEAGIQETLTAEVISLIDECEMAKYGAVSGLNMKEIYDRGCRLIDNVHDALSNSSKTVGTND